jgi:hypothetical protein
VQRSQAKKDRNSMSEHSPGPWKVSRRFYIYQDLGPNVGGTFIGSTRGNGELPESIAKVDEANAKLIASAPAMRAAAIDVLEWYYRDGSVGGACEVMDVLREAVGVSPEWLLRK